VEKANKSNICNIRESLGGNQRPKQTAQKSISTPKSNVALTRRVRATRLLADRLENDLQCQLRVEGFTSADTRCTVEAADGGEEGERVVVCVGRIEVAR
jgi:hypothetical protein